jgi:hypothetical protein
MIAFTSLSCQANSCEKLLGQWQGTWDNLRQIQSATVYFNSLNDNLFLGDFLLEHGDNGILEGSCTTSSESSAFLTFAITPPFYNPCYGRFTDKMLRVWCFDPNENGTFVKM